MAKILKCGRLVVLNRGRHAGAKAIVVKTYESTKDRDFQHALVVGISKPPGKITPNMPQYKVDQKMKIRSFVKLMNVNHMIPTRYSVDRDLEINSLMPASIDMNDQTQKKTACQKISKELVSKFLAKGQSPSIHLAFLRNKLKF
eukprot:GHVH01008457.1.p1 GENE.GHVH01008457.1~~GHVH01008457.1.p1  ORF type:complete len:144 (+),score=28.09 GHVH01008457.1:54-485(+)